METLSDISKKLLIVEDQDSLADLYKMKFEKNGYMVERVSNGMDAVVKVLDFKPDAILLDIMMPVMDGFETLRVIRELAPSLDTKIVIFSNLDKKTDIDRCYAMGADDYILKVNVTPGEVLTRIDHLLANTEHKSIYNQDGVDFAILDHNAAGESFIFCPHCKDRIRVIQKQEDFSEN